jgi:hypothetical protein
MYIDRRTCIITLSNSGWCKNRDNCEQNTQNSEINQQKKTISVFRPQSQTTSLNQKLDKRILYNKNPTQFIVIYAEYAVCLVLFLLQFFFKKLQTCLLNILTNKNCWFCSIESAHPQAYDCPPLGVPLQAVVASVIMCP